MTHWLSFLAASRKESFVMDFVAAISILAIGYVAMFLFS